MQSEGSVSKLTLFIMSKDEEELQDAPNLETDEELDESLFDEDEGGDGSDDPEKEPEKGSKEYWERRAKNAEKAIINNKKSNKAPKNDASPEGGDVEDRVRRVIQEETFYKENPELKDRKKDIDSYVSKGLTYEEAKLLVTKDERKRIANQNRSNAQRATGSPKPTQSRYTTAELESMDQAEYNSVMERREKGEVEIVD